MAGRRASILIVDDEMPVRGLLLVLLEKEYRCIGAANVDEALAALAREPFDLVVTDVAMPGRSGLELLRIINDTHPGTSVVLMSGHLKEETMAEAKRQAAGVLLKPFDLWEVKRLIERLLHDRAAS